MKPDDDQLIDGRIIGYEAVHEPERSTFVEHPNGASALMWAMLAVGLSPLFCFSLPLAAISIWCAVMTLQQPAGAKGSYRSAAILALVILVVAALGLGIGIVSLL